MTKIEWTKLNNLQIGRYGEYYAKMEFTAYGFEVYSSEVDEILKKSFTVSWRRICDRYMILREDKGMRCGRLRKGVKPL